MNPQSIFIWKGLTLLQNERVHKIGTDALLLGGWVSSNRTMACRCLDAGTGTGILAIMMGHAFPDVEIDAVDLDEEAVLLAGANIKGVGMDNRIRVFKLNLTAPEAGHAGLETYDVILSNPPYYTDSLLPSDPMRMRAKHALTPVDYWMKAFKRWLSPDGHICIIVPADKASDWISAANESGCFVHQRLDVYSSPVDILPVRSLLDFGQDLRKPLLNKLVIYTDSKTYSPDYIALTGIRTE